MNTFRLTPAAQWRPEYDAYMADMRARAGVLVSMLLVRVKNPRVDNIQREEIRRELLEPMAAFRDGGRPLTWAHVRRLDTLGHQGWSSPIGGRYLLTGEGQAFDSTLGEPAGERMQLFEIVRSALREAMTGEGCGISLVAGEVHAAGLPLHKSQLSRVLSGRQLRFPIELFDGIFRACGQSLPWALTAA